MRRLFKATALLLAAVFVVMAFAGCSKKEEQTGDQYVYIPTYTEFPYSVSGINASKLIGDKIYIIAQVMESVEKTDEEGNAYTEDNYVNKLYTMNTDGTGAEELTGFTEAAAADAEYNSSVRDIFADKDDNIWLVKSSYTDNFDLPADFDPETMNQYDYYTDSSIVLTCCRIDATGATVEEKTLYSGSDSDNFWPSYIFCGADGNWYVSDGSIINVYDADMNQLCSITDANVNSFTGLSDGKTAVIAWSDEGNMMLKTIDVAGKSLSDGSTLPSDCYNSFAGNDDYTLFYRTGTSLFGYNESNSESTKIISWLDSDINQDNISANGIFVLPDGNLLAIETAWNDDYTQMKVNLITLTKTDASTISEKKTITMACIYLDYSLRNMVLEYNKKSTEYRIKVVDYSEYNTEDDTSAGLTKLNTEIISGNVPDILYTSGMPITRYSSKGLLEDLTPYIEGDMGMDSLVTPFFDALKVDGKLYEVYSSFGLQTAVGLTKIVGDGSSWTLDDLNAALAKLPAGASVLEDYDTKSTILTNCVNNNLAGFVNWDTGECSFDTDEFVKLLEFAGSFADSFDWNSDYEYKDPTVKVREGQQLLATAYLYDFDSFRASTFYAYPEDISFVGFPTNDGTGNTFNTSGIGLAMSSKCQYKDEVWNFMRQLLTEEYQTNSNNYGGGIPTNKAAFDKLITASMTPTFDENANTDDVVTNYATTANGGVAYETTPGTSDAAAEPSAEDNTLLARHKPQVNDKGVEETPKTYYWTTDGVEIPVYAMTQAEYDILMNLINSTTKLSRYDTSITDIVTEEAQSYFSGQKTAADTAAMIQSRVKLYVNEQK